MYCWAVGTQFIQTSCGIDIARPTGDSLHDNTSRHRVLGLSRLEVSLLGQTEQSGKSYGLCNHAKQSLFPTITHLAR